MSADMTDARTSNISHGPKWTGRNNTLGYYATSETRSWVGVHRSSQPARAMIPYRGLKSNAIVYSVTEISPTRPYSNEKIEQQFPRRGRYSRYCGVAAARAVLEGH